VLKTNFKTLTMTYIRNGKVERTFPISGGKANWETKSGTKLITTHEKQRRLINPDPEDGWDVLTNYAMRITQDGEFIHDAPWNYNLGYANNSHGCTNMTTADSEWIFRNTRFGDVVKSSGSPVKVSKSEYLAGYWNYSWKEWKAGSAL
jgi:lipoprotein-anchoring transpeptidase ErfK/SrfK